jgi:hypothetical protein
MEAIYSSERSVLTGLHGVISEKIVPLCYIAFRSSKGHILERGGEKKGLKRVRRIR